MPYIAVCFANFCSVPIAFFLRVMCARVRLADKDTKNFAKNKFVVKPTRVSHTPERLWCENGGREFREFKEFREVSASMVFL